MKEKELRLALVCFGGVSLAIYIHGVTKEILKLSRASKALHFTTDRKDLSRKTYLYPNPAVTDVVDTEEVYFEILRDISEHIDIRIIIDTISGASAGGMNGIFLGRALAHDLNYDNLRHLWLEESDVSYLKGEKKSPNAFTRFITYPIIKHFSNKYLSNLNLQKNVREKLPFLLNIWNLEPPFDGKYLFGLIYRGLEDMGKGDIPKSGRNHSLLPNGHRLELFVTLTDYYGFDRFLPLNDPQYVFEKEHRHKLKFSYYSKSSKSAIVSDFKTEDIAALTFASRATACFPGAFPPAQLGEVDEYLKDKGESWIGKDKFIAQNFAEYTRSGLDPMKTSFLDGAILNNKPFSQAIKAIHNRPAFRKIDRRVIYIDPHPMPLSVQPDGKAPNMISTIKGAITDIPMNEPMHDDLVNIQNHNERVRTLKTVVDSLKPNVERMVKKITGEKLHAITDQDDMTYWRMLMNIKAIKESGFSFEGYARLKIRSVITNLTTMIGDICGHPAGSSQRRQIFIILESWVYQKPFKIEEFFHYVEGNTHDQAQNQPLLRRWIKKISFRPPQNEEIPIWAEFLYLFDVLYQRRRIQFIIQELNNQYGENSDDSYRLDELKTGFYKTLGQIDEESLPLKIPKGLKKSISQMFHLLLKLPFKENNLLSDYGQSKNWQLLEPYKDQFSIVLDNIGAAFNLEKTRRACDKLIAEQNSYEWQNGTAHSLMINYLGFAFWDGVSFSIMGAKEMGEFNQILVNRISPNDPSILKNDPNETILRGTDMHSFGAFFNRSDRENDYLWGRLNGVERLLDMLNNQIISENIPVKINITQLKLKAFKSILKSERPHLTEIPEILKDIEARLVNLK